MPSKWRAKRAIAPSFRTAPARPRTRLSRISQWPRPLAKSRLAPLAAPIASRSTTSSCVSRKNWARLHASMATRHWANKAAYSKASVTWNSVDVGDGFDQRLNRRARGRHVVVSHIIARLLAEAGDFGGSGVVQRIGNEVVAICVVARVCPRGGNG